MTTYRLHLRDGARRKKISFRRQPSITRIHDEILEWIDGPESRLASACIDIDWTLYQCPDGGEKAEIGNGCYCCNPGHDGQDWTGETVLRIVFSFASGQEGFYRGAVSAPND